jgi:FKBP-type peptidyl-prolyl cis-trans isomerase
VLKRFIAPLIFLVAVVSFSCQELEPLDDQLSREVEEIDAYLKANVTDYVAYDQSGIRLVIHQFGSLPPVHKGQKLRARVQGKLFSNGNYFTDVSFNSLLDSIGGSGLQYAIASLMVGGEASIYVPSKYAFGSMTTNDIPANSIIVYEVKLHETTRTSVEQERFTSDTTTIRRYIIDSNLSGFELHPSGVWYKITNPGNNIFPRVYDGIHFIYTGSLLSNGNVFDQGTLSNTSPFGLIDGLKVGIPQMDEGGSAIFLIPSGLAYGPQGSGTSIPGNANLKFEVELTRVIK